MAELLTIKTSEPRRCTTLQLHPDLMYPMDSYGLLSICRVAKAQSTHDTSCTILHYLYQSYFARPYLSSYPCLYFVVRSIISMSICTFEASTKRCPPKKHQRKPSDPKKLLEKRPPHGRSPDSKASRSIPCWCILWPSQKGDGTWEIGQGNHRMENGMYMIHMMPHLILDFRMMMFEDVHGQSICHIPAKRMLEQLQDNTGANLTISKKTYLTFCQHTEAESKAGSGGAAECFSKAWGKLCLASLACECMVEGPQHCLNLVDFGSGILRLAKGSNGCKALGDAPSSLSIVEQQCVEWSLSTSTMPSTTPRGKRPNDQKGRVHHLIKHFKPPKNNQGVTYSWLRPWHTMYNTSLLSNCIKLQQSWQGSGSIPQKLQKRWESDVFFLKAELMDFHVFLVDWKAQP